MKKGKQEKKSYEWRLFRLHRECVRRNADYQKDFDEWKKDGGDNHFRQFLITGKWLLGHSEPPPAPGEQNDPDEIKTLTPPKKARTPKDDEVDRFVDEGLLAVSMGPFLEPSNVPAATSGLVALTYFHENNPKKWERTAVNMRLSKQSIMDSLEFFVDLWIKERREAGLKQQRPLGRVRLETYIDYLKVYDWRKQGKKYREIAEILWPDSSATELKARTYYEKAEKLIMNPPLFGKSIERPRADSEKDEE